MKFSHSLRLVLAALVLLPGMLLGAPAALAADRGDPAPSPSSSPSPSPSAPAPSVTPAVSNTVLAPGGDAVSSFGAAHSYGPAQPLTLNQPLVGIAARPDASGYWLAAADGGIFNYGAAPWLGSLASIKLNAPVVGIASTRDGNGYWMVGADGGVFNYGDAGFLGSMGGTRLNAPVVGIAATPDGSGYWLVAADGGVFNFGSAGFFGSMGGIRLNAPVVGIGATPDGKGYWLVAADGGVFNFGEASFLGSVASQGTQVAGMAVDPNGSGYWLAGHDGHVYAFQAPALGDATAVAGSPPLVGIAAAGTDGYWLLSGDAANRYSMAPGAGLSAVQQRLQSLGFWDGGPTGAMNDATQQAIWAFQKVAGLPRTGMLDSVGLLDLAIASRPQAPRVPGGSGSLVLVDKGPDLVYLVNGGYVSWVFNTSTGGGYTYYSGGVASKAITPDGTFSIEFGINGWHTSPLGLMWRPRFFVGGFALHGDDLVPPTPVSHGCVRVSIEAMNYIWDNNLAPIGEQVTVVG